MHFRGDGAPLFHDSTIVVGHALQVLFDDVVAALLSGADLGNEHFVLLLRVGKLKLLSLADLLVVVYDALKVLLDDLHTAFFGSRDLLFKLNEFLIAMGAGALALNCHDLLVVVDDALVVPFKELMPAPVSGAHLGVLLDGHLSFGCGPSLTCHFLTAHSNLGRVSKRDQLETFGFGLFKFLVDLLKSHGRLAGDKAALESGGRGLDLRLFKLDLKFDGG